MCAKIIHIDVCDSSNAECLKFTELLNTKTEFGLTVKKQVAGRGMGNNTWFATVGKNITASFVKYPRFLDADKQFYLSMVASLAVYDLLSEKGLKTRIKWPNDIWVDNKKICGILIENSISGEGMEHCRIGIGLNVNEIEFPVELPNPVSMKQLGLELLSPDDLVYELSDHLDKWYYELKDGNLPKVKKQYLSHLMGFKKYLKYADADGEFEAKIMDVNELGYLILQDKSHKIREYEMKSVKLVF